MRIHCMQPVRLVPIALPGVPLQLLSLSLAWRVSHLTLVRLFDTIADSYITLLVYHKLGDQWATSLLAFLSLAMAPFP